MSFFAGVAQAVQEWDQQKFEREEREAAQGYDWKKFTVSNELRKALQEDDQRFRLEQAEADREENRFLLGFENLQSRMAAVSEVAGVRSSRIQNGASLLGDSDVATILEGSGQLEGLIETINTAQKNGNLDPSFIPSVIQTVRSAYGENISVDDTASAIAAALNQPYRYVGPNGEELLLSQVLAMSSADLANVKPVVSSGPSVPYVELPNQTAQPWTFEDIANIKRQLTQEFTLLNTLSVSPDGSDRSYIKIEGADPKETALETALVNAASAKVREFMDFIPVEDAISIVSANVNAAMGDNVETIDVISMVNDMDASFLYTPRVPTPTPDDDIPTGFGDVFKDDSEALDYPSAGEALGSFLLKNDTTEEDILDYLDEIED